MHSFRYIQGLGLDLGIAHQITTSNGLKIKYRVPVGPEIRKAHKEVSRTQKGSSGRRKARFKLQKAYAKTTHVKENLKNQIIAILF
ncbi:MAG: hypothetical protein AAGJ35_11895, partial [Myxococcota bacterium]